MHRPWALPLVPLYRFGLKVSSAIANARTPKRLACPVLSVGSLSAGGAGKTPVVMALAALLQQHGLTVDVLSRGYGRGSGAVEAVDPAGPASRFGDEPLEMAHAGLNVFVGASRFEAGTLAEASHRTSGTPHIHLLDDGFQHRQLWRTANVVLLTLADAQDWLLPAGNLREPLSALRRAHAVVLREDEAQALHDQVSAHTQAPIWIIRRTLVLPARLPNRLLAFCGIARPASFFTMLRQESSELAGTIALPDHHAYRHEDLQRLAAAGHDRQATGFVTTAKDAVKLTPADLARLAPVGPLVIARLQVVFTDPERVWQQLQSLLGLGPAAAPDLGAPSSPSSEASSP